jgi:hypothetical protein
VLVSTHGIGTDMTTKINLNQIQPASANNVVLGAGPSGAGQSYTEIALKTQPFTSSFGLNIDGGGLVPAPLPVTRFVTVPFDCTITGWTIIADAAGDCSFDVWFRAGTAPPSAPLVPSASDKISASAPVSMVGVQSKSGDATAIATWAKSLTSWGTLGFTLTSVNFVHSIAVQIQVTRS